MKYITTDSVSGNISGEEKVVYRHQSGIDLETTKPTMRFRCGNCKKGIHSYVDAKQGIIIRCNKTHREDCQCPCKTKYQCRFGRLHAYDTKCDCAAREGLDRKPLTPLTGEQMKANLEFAQRRQMSAKRKGFNPEAM